MLLMLLASLENRQRGRKSIPALINDFRPLCAVPLSHIPEPLWAAAVDMAGRCGISHTAKTLRVNYNALRKRVEHQAAAAPRRPEENTVTTFLELAPPRELALANALWSWRTTRGRRCGSISKALRHPTWQR
jgi:hypothetical protein